MMKKLLIVFLVLQSGLSSAQPAPLSLYDLRNIYDRQFHHVYDSTSTRVIEYLALESPHPTDVAQKVKVIRQHQYKRDVLFRDFIRLLAKKYNATPKEFQDLFEPSEFEDFIVQPLLSRVHWTDLFLLSYLHYHAGYGPFDIDYDENFDASRNENLAFFTLRESNSRMPALLLLKMKQLHGIVNPCGLYSFYTLYQSTTYSNDTTWQTTDQMLRLNEFFSVYNDYCGNAPNAPEKRTDWLGQPGNDDPLFFSQNITDRPVPKQGEKMPDLVIEEISMPEYTSEIHGTTLRLVVSNRGKAASETCTVRLISGFSETPAAKWFQEIPPIRPGKKLEITLLIPNHWVFDPNADLELLIDCFNRLYEMDEKNNRKLFQLEG